MNPSLKGLAGTLAIACTFSCGAVELVAGGGFESPVIPAGAPYLIAVTPTGWSGTGDIAVQGYAGAVSSGQGNQWFDLNPGFDAGTGIAQTVNLAAGTTYHFSFLYNGGGGGSTTQIGYSLHSAAETLLNGSVATGSLNVYGGTPWKQYSVDFTPVIGGAETLQFLPNGSYSGGFIDAVSITTTTTSPVPEPSMVLLMLVGLGSAGAYARSRNRPAA